MVSLPHISLASQSIKLKEMEERERGKGRGRAEREETKKTIATYFFCMLTMMQHHSKFGYKRLSGLEDIFWTMPRHRDR